MRNPDRQTTFRFKRFSIENARSAMKIGTDGVLLGAWADCRMDAPRVLDVGCGTGVIALMVAQRRPQAVVTGVEIDPVAAQEAAENAANSPFADRVAVVEGDFLDFNDGEYDLIICNPPFFTETLQSPDASRATARHEGSLTLASLFRHAAGLIAPEGSLCIVMPEQRRGDIEMEATLAGLNLAELCHVVTVEGKSPKRLLCRLTKASEPFVETTLAIRDSSGDFSAEYRALLEEFYLNL